ncbi:hypothetical protein CANCADRAFT_20415, partial [Tortispora caseinolytica NRRL Y-17796]
MGLYIPYKSLSGLKEYKYSSIDKSPVSNYVLKPFWRQFVKLFPLSMAPNLVTLTGLFFVLINLVTVIYYNPSLDQECPSWVYYSCAAGLFLYQTFDACDGMQARRTGSSSPLGELFDHGCDAINTTFGVIIFASTVGLGTGWKFFLVHYGILSNFYQSTWEEYYTGTLYLAFISGPVEGILMIIAIHAATGYYGPQIWKSVIGDIAFGLPLPEYILNLTLVDAYIIFATSLIIPIIIQSSISAINAQRSKPGHRYGFSSLQGLVPFNVFAAGYALWYYVVSEEFEPFHKLMFILIVIGLSFALQVGQIIIAHLTLQPFPNFSATIFICWIAVAAHYLGFSPISYTYLLIGLTIGLYAGFVGDVIADFTEFLGIHCFRV